MGFAVDLELDLLRRETCFAPSAFHPLAAFADACAQPAAEVCAVSRAPGPDAPVGCVVAAEGLAAWCAEPDGVVAGTGGSGECCEWRDFWTVVEEIEGVCVWRRVGEMVGEWCGAAGAT